MTINSSLEWIPMPGLGRDQVLQEIIKDAVEHSDHGDHVWTVQINNRGASLFCYGLQLGLYEAQGKEGNVWYVKRIPEDNEPDVYDCPITLLEATVSRSDTWRKRVIQHHVDKKAEADKK